MEGFPAKDKVLFKRVKAGRGMRDETEIILYTLPHTHKHTHRAFTYIYLHMRCVYA